MLRSLLLLAGRTQTVQFQLVVLDQEAIPLRYGALQLFNLFVLELDDHAAVRADQVVVMRTRCSVFIPHESVGEPALVRQPGIGKQPERPVDGRISDAWRAFFHQMVKFISAQVPTCINEYPQDVLPLPGRSEPPAREECRQVM